MFAMVNGRMSVVNGNQLKVYDSTGVYAFDPDSLPHVMTYNGPGGAVDTIAVGPDSAGNTFKQTLSYSGANVSGLSAWVKQ